MKNSITAFTVAAAVSLALAAPPSANAIVQSANAAPEVDQFLLDKPETLRPWYRALYQDGTRNAVLNNVRLGLVAIEAGEYERAERAFDAALEQIEAVYANDPRARQARSVWSRESVKDFKGEPYERAMAYYYRGMLYLRAGDYENARASFLQAQYQSTIAEGEEYKSSFPMMDYLAGWASQCAGESSKAQEFFSAAQASSPALKAPAATDTVLLVAETGTAPIKYTESKTRELLQFKPGSTTGSIPVQFQFNGSNVPGSAIAAFDAGSVSWQAANRGGRAIQGVLNGKAKFKDGLDAAGNVIAAVGMGAMYGGMMTGNSDAMQAGAAAGFAGMLLGALAEAAKPDADTRTWENLPDAVKLATANPQAANWQVAATVSGKPVPATRLDTGSHRCAVVWVRSHAASQIDEAAPGTQLTAGEAKKLQRKFAARDKGFRAALLSQSF